MVKPGDINQQQFANDAVQAYKDTQAKKAETSKAIEDNATRFAKGGISSGMSTGNKALDKMQQVKREKQPQNVQSQDSDFYIRYDHNGKNPVMIPKNEQPQTMYDRNGNKVIQGNGTFEHRQRQAAGQDQQFQGPTGYNVGAVVNQVSQNNQLQATHQMPAQAPQNNQPPVQTSGIFGKTYDNRRFNNAMGYLNKTFTGKKVTLDDGSQVDASQYFQDNLNRILKSTNNPKALKFYLRSLQEDMARRGVGNFDISGELLKGTGMTDGGFAKYMWNNRNQFMTQEQRPVVPSPKPTGGSKKVVNDKVVNDKPKNYTVPDGAAQRNANIATGVAAKYGAQANMHPRVAKTEYMPGSYDDNMAQYNAYAQKLALLTGPIGSYEDLNPADRKKYDIIQSHMNYFQKAAEAAKQNQKQYGDWYNPGKAALGGTEALGGAAATALGAPAPLGIAAGIDGIRRFKNGITRKAYIRSNK